MRRDRSGKLSNGWNSGSTNRGENTNVQYVYLIFSQEKMIKNILVDPIDSCLRMRCECDLNLASTFSKLEARFKILKNQIQVVVQA